MVDIHIDLTTLLFSVIISGFLCFASLWCFYVYLMELRQQVRELRGLVLNRPNFTPVSPAEFDSLFEERPDEGIEKKVKPLEDRLAEFNASMDMDF